MPTTSGRSSASATSSSAKTDGPFSDAGGDQPAGLRVEHAAGVEAVRLVVLGRLVAVALAGDRVHDHRAAEGLGPAQRALQRLDVVPVDRADVLQAEVLEHAPAARRRP